MHRLVLTTLALTLATSACSREEPAAPSREAAPPAPASEAPPTPEQAPLVSARRQIMGTWFDVKVSGVAAEKARPMLEAQLDEVARLETVLSEWRPDTEVSRVNAQAGKAPVAVGPDTLAVLQAGLEVSKASDGAFDLTWAGMRDLYKFEPGTSPVIPTEAQIAKLKKRVDYRALDVDARAGTVRLARPDMAIGTGGIAKGYALDRVGQALTEAGMTDHLLFAGGQVQVSGSRGGRPWRIGIKHPRLRDENVGFVELNDGSVSTSGDYEHGFIANGKRWHHIIDLKTGHPATKTASVTLVAPRGVYADALSTACFVVGPERCLEMLAKLPFEAYAVIIAPDMRVHISEGLRARVTFSPPLVDGKIRPAPPGEP